MKTIYINQGLYSHDGKVYFDHNYEWSNDPKIRAFQYRAAGYKNSTTKKLITTLFPQTKEKTIDNWLSNTSIIFRDRTDNIDRQQHFHTSWRKQIGKATKIRGEYTDNKVLRKGAGKRIIGRLIVEDKRLLNEIRGGGN